jgi:hypothetical protein
MTADERLVLIQRKVERAYKHIADLNTAVRLFLDSKPYKVGTKRNPQTRQLIYYLTEVSPTPISFSTITGDALQNLRSALDHLAQQLFLVGSGSNVTSRRVQFLIEQNAAQYKGRLQGVVQGMRQDAIDALSACEPYNGGKGHDFWVLHELNNIDKHRLLVTVGSSFGSVNLGAIATAELEKVTGRTLPTLPGLNAFFRPADILFPLKAGDELFIDAANAEPNQNLQSDGFRFGITLNEPGIAEGKPLLETVQHLSDLVSNTIPLFKSCLA